MKQRSAHLFRSLGQCRLGRQLLLVFVISISACACTPTPEASPTPTPDPEPRKGWANASSTDAQHPEAAEVLEKRKGKDTLQEMLAYARGSKDARRHWRLGSFLQNKARYIDAVKSYERSYALDGNEIALFNLARCKIQVSDEDEAIEHFTTFLGTGLDTQARVEAAFYLEILAKTQKRATR